jgi:regulatory protein
MMKIDSVSPSPDRAGRYTVKFQDGSVMRLHRQTVEDFKLFAGMVIEDAVITKLRTADGKISAKMRAVRIVSMSNVSKRDLERRLVQKGESAKDAEQAVAWLEELDLLDDRKTAEQIVHNCISKGYGLARAKQALYEKGIPKKYWDEVLSDYPDQSENILVFLQNRLSGEWNEKDLRRVTDALLRRGHSYQEIRNAMQKFSYQADFQEDIYG